MVHQLVLAPPTDQMSATQSYTGLLAALVLCLAAAAVAEPWQAWGVQRSASGQSGQSSGRQQYDADGGYAYGPQAQQRAGQSSGSSGQQNGWAMKSAGQQQRAAGQSGGQQSWGQRMQQRAGQEQGGWGQQSQQQRSGQSDAWGQKGQQRSGQSGMSRGLSQEYGAPQPGQWGQQG